MMWLDYALEAESENSILTENLPQKCCHDLNTFFIFCLSEIRRDNKIMINSHC